MTELNELVDRLDEQVSQVPHGNTILLPNGGCRAMTIRDQFAAVFNVFRRENPPGTICLDPDVFIDYWRDCILTVDPPAVRPLPPARVKKKGGHLVVLPALVGPTLRAAADHFEFLDILGISGLAEIRVQRVRRGFVRKTTLDQKHRFNPPTENLFCLGSRDQLRAFIYDQRGQRPHSPRADLVRYLTEIVGQSSQWVEKFVGLREWAPSESNTRNPD